MSMNRTDTMNTSKLITALRDYDCLWADQIHLCRDAADTIDSLTEDFNNASDRIGELEKALRGCRNELCLRCGRYHERHLGACDGCRWKENYMPGSAKEK